MFEKKDYKKVAHTELRVSPITLGTMTFGDQNSQKEAFDQLDYALDQGINSFDVAEMYPVPPKPETCNATEIIIGNWIEKKKRDLLYLHWPERNVPMFGQYKFDPKDEYKNTKKIQWVSIEEQLKSLMKLVDDGKVRYIALSNEYPWGVMEFIRVAKEKKLPLICAVQNSYSLINRIAELGLSEILYREDLGFFTYSPLGFGHLTGKYIQDPESSGRVNLFPGYAKRYNKPGVTLAVEDYLHIAKEANLSLTQMALSFAYRQWFVTSTIIGATSINQLKENISAYEIILKDDILEKIDQTHLKRMNPAP
jgi:aryl-alcohol dehydrogenase-like predicted oxidoreductase